MALSTRYTRTGPMNPANQVSVQTMFTALHGDWLPSDELLAAAHAAGLVDAFIRDGRVLLPGAAYKGADGVLDGTRSIELAARRRAARAA